MPAGINFDNGPEIKRRFGQPAGLDRKSGGNRRIESNSLDRVGKGDDPGPHLGKDPNCICSVADFGTKEAFNSTSAAQNPGEELFKKKLPSPSSEKNELKLNTARAPTPKLLFSDR